MVVLKLEKESDLARWLRQYSDKPVMVKFFTTWCGSCQVLQENLEKLQTERAKSNQLDLVVVAVNADNFPTLKYQDRAQKIQQLAVYSIPTLFLFREEKKLKEEKGVLSMEQLRNFVNNY